MKKAIVNYETNLKKIVLTVLKDEPAKVILFGSRARGDHNACSDIDIGILFQNKNADKKKFILLKDKLENINIPYKIDLVDMDTVPNTMKKIILKDGKIWKN